MKFKVGDRVIYQDKFYLIFEINNHAGKRTYNLENSNSLIRYLYIPENEIDFELDYEENLKEKAKYQDDEDDVDMNHYSVWDDIVTPEYKDTLFFPKDFSDYIGRIYQYNDKTYARIVSVTEVSDKIMKKVKAPFSKLRVSYDLLFLDSSLMLDHHSFDSMGFNEFQSLFKPVKKVPSKELNWNWDKKRWE